MKWATQYDQLKHKEHTRQKELFDLIDKLLDRIKQLENELAKSHDRGID